MVKKLQREDYFAKHGVKVSDLREVPKSLKLLHKFVACTCLVVVGIQACGFNKEEIYAKYSKIQAEEDGADTRKSQNTSKLNA